MCNVDYVKPGHILIMMTIQAPIAWDSVDVSPVKNADGTMGIPQVLLMGHTSGTDTFLSPV